MKRKLLSTMLCVAMAATMLAGCGSKADTDSADTATATTETTDTKEADTTAATSDTATAGGLIGVAMPTKDLQRWNQDGTNMKAELEAAGYEVELQYASNDVATQVSQIETMITNGCKVLVIASIDGDSLGTPLAQAKEAGISVIAYDRLIMNSDAVSYYATFDNYMVGTKQGKYIEEKLDLKKASKPLNLEIFTGDPGDNNARFFYSGAMDVLQKYIDSGVLVVKSGSVDFADVATAEWSTEKAQNRMDAIISSNYNDGTVLDAVLCSNDSTAQGVTNAIDAAGWDTFPIITGQDCDIPSVKNMIAGKQSMSIFKDTRTLATKTVEMVNALMTGTEAPVNNTETYDNGTGVIPSFLCEPVFADVTNYKELLIDSGYYKESDLQ
jgi:putative multiple sugar transport system substrate-binding protein